MLLWTLYRQDNKDFKIKSNIFGRTLKVRDFNKNNENEFKNDIS